MIVAILTLFNPSQIYSMLSERLIVILLNLLSKYQNFIIFLRYFHPASKISFSVAIVKKSQTKSEKFEINSKAPDYIIWLLTLAEAPVVTEVSHCRA